MSRPDAWSISCSRLARTAAAVISRVLRPHVRVTHQHHRLATALPGEDFQPGLVVVVVGALALRHVAPGPGDVAGGIGVLQEVQRERLVGQHRARQRLPFGRLRGASVASRVAFCRALRWNQA